MSPDINKPTAERANRLHVSLEHEKTAHPVLHDLILRQATGMLSTLHDITVVLVGILHV